MNRVVAQCVQTVLLRPGDVFVYGKNRFTAVHVQLGGKRGVVQVAAVRGSSRKVLSLDPTADVAVVGGAR